MKNYPIDFIEDGEITRIAEDKLFLDVMAMCDDNEETHLLLTQNVVELNERRIFLEGVASYLGKDDNTCASELLAEVKVRYKERGIELTNTVKGWFQEDGATPSTKQAHRRNLYDFCVAMGMDYRETAKFFFKAFQTIAYNYKDRVDAVYFYCLKEKRPYSVIRQLLEKAKTIETTNVDIESTKEIGLQILEIRDDEAFLEYLKRCCYDKKHQYTTARGKIRDLVEKNKKMVLEKNPSIIDLLKEILGYAYQELNAEQRAAIGQSGLPVFPNDVDISNALSNDKDVSFDVLRRSLILMQFYNFYRNWHNANKQPYMEENEITENFEDFYEDINAALAECGFVQMYVRNPYDWIILYCAKSSNPLEYLKDFVEKRYLGLVD